MFEFVLAPGKNRLKIQAFFNIEDYLFIERSDFLIKHSKNKDEAEREEPLKQYLQASDYIHLKTPAWLQDLQVNKNLILSFSHLLNTEDTGTINKRCSFMDSNAKFVTSIFPE